MQNFLIIFYFEIVLGNQTKNEFENWILCKRNIIFYYETKIIMYLINKSLSVYFMNFINLIS